MSIQGRRVISEAYGELESEVPDSVARAMRWLRAPRMRWLRITAGVLFLVAGCLWFLPVVGLEFLPVGLLLLAEDVPFLRKPVGRMILWFVDRWRAARRWWRTTRTPHAR